MRKKSTSTKANKPIAKQNDFKIVRVKPPLWWHRRRLFAIQLRGHSTDLAPLYLLNKYADGTSWAYPGRIVLTCFRKALMPLPAKTLDMLNCLKHGTEEWSLKNESRNRRSNRMAQSIDELSWNPGDPSAQNIYSLIHDLLTSKGSERARKCRKLKQLLSNAIDLLATDGLKMRDPRRKLITILKHEIPFSLLQFDRISRYRYVPTLLEWSQGVSTYQEAKALKKKHHKDRSIIKLPIACVAIEYARRFVQTHERLPFKKELRKMIQDAHPEETEGLSHAFWCKVWVSSGLKSLKRDGKW